MIGCGAGSDSCNTVTGISNGATSAEIDETSSSKTLAYISIKFCCTTA